MIAFYIGLTGFACTIYYRRELFRSVKNFFFIGVGPTLGGAILFYLLIKNAIELSDPANSESGNSWFGLGPPLVIAVFFLLLGVVLMFVQWRKVPEFFRRKPEVVPPASSRAKRRTGPDRSGVRWARSSSDTTAPTCGDAALDAALELAGELGDRIVVVFGYAPPGIWGGEIAEHEEAIEELGEKVIGEAARSGRGRRGPRSRSSWSPKAAAEALIEVADERDARMIVVGSSRRAAAQRDDPRLDPATSFCTSPSARCWSCPTSD